MGEFKIQQNASDEQASSRWMLAAGNAPRESGNKQLEPSFERTNDST